MRKKKINLKTVMKSTPNFVDNQRKYFRDFRYSKCKTICIDIVNTIVIKEEINDPELLEHMMQDKENFQRDYVLVENHMDQDQVGECCRVK